MNWIEILQTTLLIFLVDRSLFVRNRYKIGIDCSSQCFVLWLLCKKGQDEYYSRATKLLRINFKA